MHAMHQSTITNSPDLIVSGHNVCVLPEHCVLRSTTVSDLPDLRLYFGSLSETTRRLRLQVWSNDVPTSVLQLFDGSDSQLISGFVLLRSAGDNTILGEGILARSTDSSVIELGVSIADAWRGCGLGKTLITRLITRAVQMGCRTLHADTLRENTTFIQVASSLGFIRKWHPSDSTQIRMSLELQN